MQQAKELFAAGRLGAAVEALGTHLRTKPIDATGRVFLFELLCFQGDLKRAARQLDILAEGAADPRTRLAIDVNRQLLEAERRRRLVFHGDGLPRFLSEPPLAVGQALLNLRRELSSDGAVSPAPDAQRRREP